MPAKGHKQTSLERPETDTLSVREHPRDRESVEAKGMPKVNWRKVGAVPIDAVAVVRWLQHFLQQESNNRRMGYALAIAGHVGITLILLLGFFARTEPPLPAAVPV